jgi:hypothetical protein
MTGFDPQGRLTTRSLRRHQRLRMIARARRSLNYSDMDDSERTYWALRQFDHLKSCSCWMCGNPRKYEGEPTIQERRRLAAIDRDDFRLAWGLD